MAEMADQKPVREGYEAHAESEEGRDLARRLAARRRVVTAPCAVCGATFTGYAHRKFCSARCAKRAWALAHPEKVQAARQRWRARRAPHESAAESKSKTDTDAVTPPAPPPPP